MSDSNDELKFPTEEDLLDLINDENTFIKKLVLTFSFNNKCGPLPFSIAFSPDAERMDEIIILLAIAAQIRVLAKRQGLEEALQKVNEIVYGRLYGKRVLKIGDARIPKSSLPDEYADADEGEDEDKDENCPF